MKARIGAGGEYSEYKSRSSMSYQVSSPTEFVLKEGSLLFDKIAELHYVVVKHLQGGFHQIYGQTSQKFIDVDLSPHPVTGYTPWEVIHAPN